MRNLIELIMRGWALFLVSLVVISAFYNIATVPQEELMHTRGCPDCTAPEETLTIPYAQAGSRDDGGQYAVLVGINDYPGTANDLYQCVNDVNSMRNTLINTYGWPASNIRVLTDSQATTSNIISALQWVAQQEGPNSQVLFHFSGHGNYGYLVTYSGSLTDETLANQFAAFDSDEKVIVLDACRAGSNTALNMDSTITIMACQANQYSYDGMFTPHFVSHLTSTASVESAFQAAKNEVNSATGGSQTPMMWDNVPGDLLLGDRPPSISPAIPPQSADEDTPISVDLTPYERDDRDTGAALKWTVTDYDPSFVATIEGENSADDVITIYPRENVSGSTYITFTLSDSKSHTTSQQVMFTWNPVNDAPAVQSITLFPRGVKRGQEAAVKVTGKDAEDQASKLRGELQYRLKGTSTWIDAGTLTYKSSFWQGAITPDLSAELGSYDVRARLKDTSGIFGDWYVKKDAMTVLNNPPVITGAYVMNSTVERLGTTVITVEGLDAEDDAGSLTCSWEYMVPGGGWESMGTCTYGGGSWNISFSPDAAYSLGLYSFRIQLQDTDGDTSPWYYLNDSIEVVNGKPIITNVSVDYTEIFRGGKTGISISGFDPEDPGEYLECSVEYMPQNGSWDNLTCTYMDSMWYAELETDRDSPLGEYSIRVMLVDSLGETKGWYHPNLTVTVKDAPPEIRKVVADQEVTRGEPMEIGIYPYDYDTSLQSLVVEGTSSYSGDVWTDTYFDTPKWDSKRGIWTIDFTPESSSLLGKYTLRLRLYDGSSYSEYYQLKVSVKNALPVASADIPELIHQSKKASFDASSSYDPDGKSLDYSWDFGDGTKANGEKVTHIYTTYGKMKVRLTVVDADHGSTTATWEITVNALPSAQTSVEMPVFGSTVTLTASGTDPDGHVVKYKWDFNLDVDSDGDGNPANDADAVGETVTHDFGTGKHQYALTVVDDQGGESTVVKDVDVPAMSLTGMGIVGGVIAAVAVLVGILIYRQRY